MYLVIETHNVHCQNFTHFISLLKSEVEDDIRSFLHHVKVFDDIYTDKVYFSVERLSNW